MAPFASFVIVFAVFYFASFLLELFRFFRRFDLCVVPAAVGFAYHTAYLFVAHIVAEQPIGGTAMLFLASAWGLILLYFVWAYRYPNIPFGLVLLPLTLLLLGGGYLSAVTIKTNGLSLQSLAKMLHIASAAGFVITFSVGCICRVLYLFEVRLLRKKRSLTPPTKLPSLEWSETVCRISLAIAACCLCLCGLAIVLFLFVRG